MPAVKGPGWLSSFLIALTTAAVGCLLAGYVAGRVVDWHRISSFEGQAGYFVVLVALAGLVGGFVVGLVVSRIAADGGLPRAFAFSHLAVIGIILLSGGWARLVADVPPTLDDEELLLAVEIRWPQGRDLAPQDDNREWFVRLGSLSGRTMRAHEPGPLWREDARQEDGRWIVPGAVEIFTSRGERVIDVLPEDLLGKGFIVPLPGHPGGKHLEWSEWLPRESADGFSYRFRVVPQNRVIRTETHGGFEIGLVARHFWQQRDERGRTFWLANGQFEITHEGRPVSFGASGGRVVSVATVNSPAPALLALVQVPQAEVQCLIVRSEGGEVRTERIPGCGKLRARPLTSDASVFARARAFEPLPGRVDRGSFAAAGLYLFDEAVLDTRSLSVIPLAGGPPGDAIARIPPLAVSPDEGSFAWLGWDDTSDARVALLVTRIATGESYRLPIDRSRMRYADIDQIDPAWVSHYFAWTRDRDGSDRLVPRGNAAPLPHRGFLMYDDENYREYRLAPARAGLRDALIEFLVSEFGGERLGAEGTVPSPEVRIGDTEVHVSHDADRQHVSVWVDRGANTRLVLDIARRFDAALESGKYDHLFD